MTRQYRTTVAQLTAEAILALGFRATGRGGIVFKRAKGDVEHRLVLDYAHRGGLRSTNLIAFVCVPQVRSIVEHFPDYLGVGKEGDFPLGVRVWSTLSSKDEGSPGTLYTAVDENDPCCLRWVGGAWVDSDPSLMARAAVEFAVPAMEAVSEPAGVAERLAVEVMDISDVSLAAAIWHHLGEPSRGDRLLADAERQLTLLFGETRHPGDQRRAELAAKCREVLRRL